MPTPQHDLGPLKKLKDVTLEDQSYNLFIKAMQPCLGKGWKLKDIHNHADPDSKTPLGNSDVKLDLALYAPDMYDDARPCRSKAAALFGEAKILEKSEPFRLPPGVAHVKPRVGSSSPSRSASPFSLLAFGLAIPVGTQWRAQWFEYERRRYLGSTFDERDEVAQIVPGRDSMGGISSEQSISERGSEDREDSTARMLGMLNGQGSSRREGDLRVAPQVITHKVSSKETMDAKQRRRRSSSVNAILASDSTTSNFPSSSLTRLTLKIRLLQHQRASELAKGDGQGPKIVTTVPDLIAALDAQSGCALGTPDYKYGLRVLVLGITAAPQWTNTERGLELGKRDRAREGRGERGAIGGKASGRGLDVEDGDERKMGEKLEPVIVGWGSWLDGANGGKEREQSAER
ncbi:uncharacterized protein STEHIDRAFT_113723 [Stereum hirsutum FP-91666 SS1]|uniref:uncharacterized protein n=1 Tax=Stereum hirsutum (strain FP-91666) TaxID=721885 RepID=UPI000444946B|nr:uncharacterized protein STEHIDRAFT_113723 [Stereum hirsutum FP-91666 SS1]EIM83645.1 hypothetical protein STEHIDRAFT_113723 [Stereum hirsutum FP-91666 SS1]